MQFCLKRIPDYSVCIIHYFMVVVSNKQVYIFFFSSFCQKLDKSAKPKNVFLQQVPYLKPWTKRSIRALISTSTPAGAGSETHPFPQVIQCGTGFRNCHTQIFIISKTYQVIRTNFCIYLYTNFGSTMFCSRRPLFPSIFFSLNILMLRFFLFCEKCILTRTENLFCVDSRVFS